MPGSAVVEVSKESSVSKRTQRCGATAIAIIRIQAWLQLCHFVTLTCKADYNLVRVLARMAKPAAEVLLDHLQRRFYVQALWRFHTHKRFYTHTHRYTARAHTHTHTHMRTHMHPHTHTHFYTRTLTEREREAVWETQKQWKIGVARCGNHLPKVFRTWGKNCILERNQTLDAVSCALPTSASNSGPRMPVLLPFGLQIKLSL